MSYNGEKLYRVKIKTGNHINKKVNKDGSRAAIQFDKKNGLQGPVDLEEVDEDDFGEYLREKYCNEDVEQDFPSSSNYEKNDIGVELVAELLFKSTIFMFEWAHEVIKEKRKIKMNRPHVRENKRFQNKKVLSGKQSPMVDCETKEKISAQQPIYHTQEEVDCIVNDMKYAALYIAAKIHELTNTIIVADTPEKVIEVEGLYKELSSNQIMQTIDHMLEDKNCAHLDQVTQQLFKYFRNNELYVDGEVIPISRYLTIESRFNNIR